MKNKAVYGIIIIVAILVLLMVVVSNTALTDLDNLKYDTEWDDIDITNFGTWTSIATMQLTENTQNFDLVVNFDLKAKRDQSEVNYDDCRASINYEILNQQTLQYEPLHSSSWNLKSINGADVDIDGYRIYTTGIPDHVVTINTRDDDSSANRRYDKYYSCLPGMSNSDMLNLIENARETDSRYTFKCLYPGESINEHEDRDDSDEDYDWVYFPSKHSYNPNYINSENQVIFRLGVIKQSECDNPTNEGDLKIRLLQLSTIPVNMYNYIAEQDECVSVERQTYQIESGDFIDLAECEYKNNITTIAPTTGNVIDNIVDVIVDQVIPDETDEDISFFWIAAVWTVLILIVVVTISLIFVKVKK